MANIKTAISIEKVLFEEIEAMAEELEVSRSRIFSLATHEFIQRYKNRKLFDTINASYEDSPSPAEKVLLKSMKVKQRKVIAEKW
ncbi:MAG: hypothetical protein PHE50_01020 [Dehalococcoidales bacterium]|nr:hypothetical protein [Dehalococcoidales bacterium]